MPDWQDYKGIQVPLDDPTGQAGLYLKNDLKALVDWSPKSVWGETTDPVATNDVTEGFYPGSLWLNSAAPALFVCVDNTTDAAQWARVGAPTSQTLAVFSPLNNLPPSSGTATFDVRNEVPVLAFDKTTNEAGVFLGVVPQAYAGGDVTVAIDWVSSETSGDVVWNAQFRRLRAGQDNIDSGSFGSAQSAITSAAGTAGQVTQSAIPFTNAQAESIAAGDGFLLKLTRNASSGSDTMDNDAEVVSLQVTQD